MLPYIHYDPDHLSAPMATKSTVRLIFGLTAKLGLTMEHFDIKGAFLHEAFGYGGIVYVKEPKRADGTYRHGNTVGVLRGNMYGGRSAGNYFLKGLTSWLNKFEYTTTDVDPCIYYKRDGDHYIIFSISIDDFLVCSNSEAIVDALFEILKKNMTLSVLASQINTSAGKYIVKKTAA